MNDSRSPSGWHPFDVNSAQRGVDWQMKIDDARCKLASVYRKIKLGGFAVSSFVFGFRSARTP